MSLPLYMDEHIPSAITAELQNRGIDVLTVQMDNRSGLPDPQVMRRAYELRRIIVTEDHDYERSAVDFWSRGENFYGIAFITRRGTTFGVIIADLETLAVCSEVDEVINRINYIPLR